MREIRTTLQGNATGDPQPREGNDGPFTSILRIAVTPSYYDSEKGTYGDRKTEFITVFARNQLARNVLASVTKGQPLVVTGRLNSSEWTGVDGTVRHSLDRKSTRLNSSHVAISYAVFCLTKKE